MATVVINRSDHIEFKNLNVVGPQENPPTLSLQAGEWGNNNAAEVGIVVDVSGAQLPLLSSADARKLSKWLNKVADDIDGVRADKKRKTRFQHDDADELY